MSWAEKITILEVIIHTIKEHEDKLEKMISNMEQKVLNVKYLEEVR